MTQDVLKKILKEHKKWLNDTGGKRANLSNANLSNANLSNVNLRGADLRYAILSNADLRYADLRYADLRDADLSNANLRYADLRDADLSNADLSNADLSNANLSNANLSNANLSNSITNYLTIGIAMACPEKGAFTAYKRVREFIIELIIPAHAQRSSATTRKCRASEAFVVSITYPDGSPAPISSVLAIQRLDTPDCIYTVGQPVFPDSFNPDRWNECSHGIHFFLSREDAVTYNN